MPNNGCCVPLIATGKLCSINHCSLLPWISIVTHHFSEVKRARCTIYSLSYFSFMRCTLFLQTKLWLPSHGGIEIYSWGSTTAYFENIWISSVSKVTGYRLDDGGWFSSGAGIISSPCADRLLFKFQPALYQGSKGRILKLITHFVPKLRVSRASYLFSHAS